VAVNATNNASSILYVPTKEAYQVD